MILVYFILAIFCGNLNVQSRLISSELGYLEAGNFSYYELAAKGKFKLVLESEQGDCDLYASDKAVLVDYVNYDLQSTTYGIDEILIEETMHRPVYIGVYAHPYYSFCKYTLNQFKVDSNEYYSYVEHVDSSKEELEEKKDEIETEEVEQEEKESFFWWLFINLLQLIAEAVL